MPGQAQRDQQHRVHLLRRRRAHRQGLRPEEAGGGLAGGGSGGAEGKDKRFIFYTFRSLDFIYRTLLVVEASKMFAIMWEFTLKTYFALVHFFFVNLDYKWPSLPFSEGQDGRRVHVADGGAWRGPASFSGGRQGIRRAAAARAGGVPRRRWGLQAGRGAAAAHGAARLLRPAAAAAGRDLPDAAAGTARHCPARVGIQAAQPYAPERAPAALGSGRPAAAAQGRVEPAAAAAGSGAAAKGSGTSSSGAMGDAAAAR